MKKLIIIALLLFAGNLLNAQVGIGTITPGNTLEINSSTTGESGLRFTQLNSNSAAVSNTPAKVLGLNTAGDVVFTALYPQVVSVNTTLDANTPANTTLTLGEIQFRTDKTSPGITGNIQVRSSSASTLAVTIFGHEEYNTGTNNYTAVSAVLNDNLGAFTTFFAGGLNLNELLVYRIVTVGGGIYRITLFNRNDTDIYLVGEKLK
ncbi:hypothetical protein [Flavobacterium soyae]|uniref:hypothetical protein n=1 Tax=Flavobacterium soyae TaxID=2903098 RepID=UPI001E653F1C|nr:hypothetical protein [Flavobacterium soyae]MCD9576558.1 hypothetical protein [Flavobacterium soyae]